MSFASGSAAATATASAAPAITPMTNSRILNVLSKINVSALSADLSTRRRLEKLSTDIKLLQVAINKYNKLFNFQKNFEFRRNMTMKRSTNLLASGAPQANINRTKANLKKIFENYNQSRQIMASNDPIAKEIALKSFIEAIDDLRKAYEEVQKDLMVTDATTIFPKPSGFFAKNNRKEQLQQIINDIAGIVVMLKTNRVSFRKLLDELEGAKEYLNSAQQASALGARLSALRNNKYSIPNTTVAEREAKLKSVIAKIQAKLNATTRVSKGGKRHTRRHRSTRRNK